MDSSYGKAESVIVWLGGGAECSDRLFEAFKDLKKEKMKVLSLHKTKAEAEDDS